MRIKRQRFVVNDLNQSTTDVPEETLKLLLLILLIKENLI
jgi:hypothetical protein